MKKYISLIAVLCVVFVWGCQSNKTAPSASAVAPVTVDGTYVFDAQIWKDAMTKLDPNFTQAPAELITKMTEAFSSFNMVVAGNKITANFGPTVFDGTLEEVSKADNEVKYKMVPTAAEQQQETIIIKITDGNKMVAGPEGNDKQLLYFSKK